MNKEIIILLLIIFLGCSDGVKKEKKIKSIPIDLKIERFDSLYFNVPETNFKKIKQKYPYFFPNNIPDTFWINKRNSSLDKELFSEVNKQYKNFKNIENQLVDLFKHVKYYFPELKIPKLITLVTDVDYQSRVVYADTILTIGLDNYLGANHRFYKGMPGYIRSEFELKYLPVDIALALSGHIFPKKKNITFLDEMIWQGKQLFLVCKFLPKYSLEDILKISSQKYQWVKDNESNIWRYFVENQLIYNTEKKTIERFISLAPFSKFYLESDRESPSGVGRYIGYQIVKSFVQKNSIELTDLLKIDNEELFKKSNYKPKK